MACQETVVVAFFESPPINQVRGHLGGAALGGVGLLVREKRPAKMAQRDPWNMSPYHRRETTLRGSACMCPVLCFATTGSILASSYLGPLCWWGLWGTPL